MVQPFGCSSGRFSSLDQNPEAASVRLHILDNAVVKVCAAHTGKKFDFGKHVDGGRCCCWWCVWTQNSMEIAGKRCADIYIPYYQLLVQSKQINIAPVPALVRPSTHCITHAGFCLFVFVNYFRFGFHQMPTGNFVYK